jgi:hypothetical protein
MITEEIKNLLRATPFIPFTIHVSNGTTFEVPHPDFAFVSPNGMVVFVFVKDVSNRIVGHQITHVTTKGETQVHL